MNSATQNGLEILPGHFVKVFRDGKCVARAYAQVDGAWAIGTGPDRLMVNLEYVKKWAALMALAA